MAKEISTVPKVFLLPGIDGMANFLEPLASNLCYQAFCLHFTYSDQPEATIQDIAKSLLPCIHENLPETSLFTLVGYSYGCMVAIELAALLEAEGRTGETTLIDGAPAMFQELLKRQLPEADSEDHLQTRILCGIMQLYASSETVLKHTADIFKCKTLEERVDMVLGLTSANSIHSKKFQRQVYLAAYFRFKSVIMYHLTFGKLKSLVKLIKPSQFLLEDFGGDYELQQLCEKPVEVHTFDGNHVSVVKNPKVASTINAIVDADSAHPKQSSIKDIMSLENMLSVGVKQIQ